MCIWRKKLFKKINLCNHSKLDKGIVRCQIQNLTCNLAILGISKAKEEENPKEMRMRVFLYSRANHLHLTQKEWSKKIRYLNI